MANGREARREEGPLAITHSFVILNLSRWIDQHAEGHNKEVEGDWAAHQSSAPSPEEPRPTHAGDRAFPFPEKLKLLSPALTIPVPSVVPYM